MTPVVHGSSHVARIDWDPRSRALSVTYKGGRIYTYEAVDYETWTRLMNAPSKGAFLRREIQPRHRVKETTR